jgi:predicted ester cyclase
MDAPLESNKRAFRRFYDEFVNKGTEAAADELLAPDLVSHSPFPGQPPGSAGVKETFARFRAAFPDLRARLEDVVAEGDRVVGRFTVGGTHKGEFMGQAPTGKRVSYEEMVILRFQDGRIVEHWAVADALALMQGIGALPSAGT